MDAKKTKDVMELPVETKLSKGELIDLVIESTVEDLERQIEELEEESLQLMDIDSEELDPSCLKGRGKLRYDYDGHYSIAFEVSKRGTMAARIKRLEETRSRQEQLRTLLRKLRNDRVKAKNTVLRGMLESTEEGRRTLEAVELFRTTVKARLVGDTIQEKLSG